MGFLTGVIASDPPIDQGYGGGMHAPYASPHMMPQP